MMAALRWAFPSLPRPLRVGLPQASAAVAGWKKLEPGLLRPAMHRVVALALALVLCRRRLGLKALLLLVLFET